MIRFYNGYRAAISCSLSFSLAFTCLSPAYAYADEKTNSSIFLLESAADELFKDIMSTSPISLHYSYTDTSKLDISLENPLGEYAETSEKTLEILNKAKDTLSNVKMRDLDYKQAIVYTRMKKFIDENLSFCELPDYTNTLGVMGGVLTNLDTMITEYYLLSKTDIENYLDVLRDIPRFLQDVLKEIEYQEGIGYAPSSYAYEQALSGRTLATTLEGHCYVESFEANIEEVGLDDSAKESYIDNMKEIMSDVVIPAFNDFFDALEEKSKTAEASRGLCEYEGGSDYYEALVRDNTGTDMTPSELKEYLEEKIESEMTMISEIYYSDPDALTNAYNIEFADTDAASILNTLKSLAEENMPELKLPDYTLSYLPEALQTPNILAYYLSSPIDDLGRNVIRINGSTVGDDNALLWTTMAHEGFPGHMYQTQYFMQNSFKYDIESVMDSIATSEGWAQYGESLALGWAGIDENEAAVYIADSMLSMALISVVDIGVNYESWDAYAVADYLTDYYGELTAEEGQQFVDLCANDPAAYLPYSVGYYKTADIFEQLKGKYSSDKEMYATYLKYGALPFSMLEFYLTDSSI